MKLTDPDPKEIPLPRWIATVIYRTNAGTVDVEFPIDELDELPGIIERGPHWKTIVMINVELIDQSGPMQLTLQANGKEWG
jgi:hypothetical protein